MRRRRADGIGAWGAYILRVCVCVCVCTYIHTYIHTYTYTYRTKAEKASVNVFLYDNKTWCA